MNCQDFEPLLCEYHSGELGPENVSIVESHLKGCPVCGEKLSVIRQASKAVQSLPLKPLPKNFTDSVMVKIQGKETEDSDLLGNEIWLLRIFQPKFAVIAMCGLIIGLALFFGPPNFSRKNTRISLEGPPFFSLAQTRNLLQENFQSPERSGCLLVCNSAQEDSPYLSMKNSQRVFQIFSSQKP